MRTSQELRRIADLADAYRKDRGDTEWSPEDREKITSVLAELRSVGPKVPRYSRVPRTGKEGDDEG